MEIVEFFKVCETCIKDTKRPTKPILTCFIIYLVETKCNENNGGCSHLCLLSTNVLKYSCRCPDGMVLRADGKSCLKIGKPKEPITNKTESRNGENTNYVLWRL